MTYILLISLILITSIVSIYMMFARQNAIDYFLGLTHIFTLFILVTYYIELVHKVSFEGSLITIFGVIFSVAIPSAVIIRFKYYQDKGNSNIEG
ncbi:MAG: hypothetical protein CES88_08440 [Halobacteriovorax sp. JY17]|nr:MAG: hypothetical protein CES88_08440 [Halobacteriovorax sp. JY17]